MGELAAWVRVSEDMGHLFGRLTNRPARHCNQQLEYRAMCDPEGFGSLANDLGSGFVLGELKIARSLMLLTAGLALAGSAACRGAPAPGSAPPADLVVFNAASLAPSFKAIGDSLVARTEIGRFIESNGPSLDVVRRLTELGQVPDLLATADVALFDRMIRPKYADWYLVFGTNALVLAYGPRSPGHDRLTTDGWWRVLLRPGVRTGRSDPTLDPSGYRTLMALELAERHYHEPGLAQRLLAAMPARYIRRAEADLSALVEAGELDYIWTYRNLALAHRLSFVELPPEIDLSDPARADWYAQATARVRAGEHGDTVELRGAPIEFGLTVPRLALHPASARAFIRFLLSPAGAAVLRRTGFTPLSPPRVVGPAPADLGVPSASR